MTAPAGRSRGRSPWFARVSKSLRSSGSNVLMSLRESDTRSVPTSVDSPVSGATSALRPFRRVVPSAPSTGARSTRRAWRSVTARTRIGSSSASPTGSITTTASPARLDSARPHRPHGAAKDGSRPHRPGTSFGRARAATRSRYRVAGCAGGSRSTRRAVRCSRAAGVRRCSPIGESRSDGRQDEEPGRSGLSQRTVRPMSAMLAFVRETTMPIFSISGMRRYWAVPSASEIAVLTLSTPMTFSTRATTRTRSTGPARTSRRPEPPRG